MKKGTGRFDTIQLEKSLRRANSTSAAPRRRLGEQAYETIKSALLDGMFAPGQRLAIDELVAELESSPQQIKTSRQPVMDALKRLEAEGFVEITPQVGCRVIAHDREQISDFFRFVAASEGLMAELAATRRTNEDLILLETISRRIGALRTAKLKNEEKGHEYRLLNRLFHGQIHAMARSASLSKYAASLWDRADFYISAAQSHHAQLFADRLSNAHDEHEAVRDAIERKAAATARRAMENHILEFAQEM